MLVLLRRADGSGIAFDATPSESHTKRSTMTKFPIEQGASITDHLRTDGSDLTLNGIVGAAPLRTNLIGAGPSGLYLGLPEAVDRVQRAYEEILKMQDNAEVLTVVTSLKTYVSMVITATSVPRTSATGLILDLTVTLQKLVSSTLETVDLPAPKLPRAKATKDAGLQNAEEKEVEVPTAMARDALRGITRLAGGDAGFASLERLARP